MLFAFLTSYLLSPDPSEGVMGRRVVKTTVYLDEEKYRLFRSVVLPMLGKSLSELVNEMIDALVSPIGEAYWSSVLDGMVQEVTNRLKARLIEEYGSDIIITKCPSCNATRVFRYDDLLTEPGYYCVKCGLKYRPEMGGYIEDVKIHMEVHRLLRQGLSWDEAITRAHKCQEHSKDLIKPSEEEEPKNVEDMIIYKKQI